MEDRILNVMRTRKQEIEDSILMSRWWSRVKKLGTVVEEYQRTLHPHDFWPSVDDVCRTPDIRKVIIHGTEEEFSICVEEVVSELPKLTSKLLEERIAKLSALIPFNKRPDNVLSLATFWFECEMCGRSPIHGTDALRHERVRSDPREGPVGETTFDTVTLRRSWCPETPNFKFSTATSTIARGLILECGEDPESVTLAEMNCKPHRFIYREKDLFAYGWRDTVSPSGPVGVHRCGLIIHHTLSSLNVNLGIPPRIDSLDRTNVQSLCTIPTFIAGVISGSVSIAGGTTDPTFTRQ